MYYLRQFDSVVLPNCSIADDMGSMSTVNTGVLVAGGVMHDAYGTSDAPTGPSTYRMVASLVENDAATLETSYRALLAKRGAYGKLYRTWDSSGLTEWSYARLGRVDARYRHIPNAKIIVGISAQFQMRSPVWNGYRHGDGWTLDSGEFFDTGLVLDEATGDVFTLSTTNNDFTVNNGGSVNVVGVNIQVEQVGASAITNLAFQKDIPGLAALSPVFTLTTNTTSPSDYLEIDTGLKTVQLVSLTTVDAYNDFSLDSSNPYENWLELEPGDNDFRVVKTGGNATDVIRFTFYDAWA